MAGSQGRDLLLKLGNGSSPETFTAIAGLTSAGIALANGTLDITNNDDDGVRKLLAGKYAMAATISGSGVAQDASSYATLRTNFLAGTAHNYQVVIPGSTGGGTYSFSGVTTAFEETGETDGYHTFNITIESAGAVTFA